MEKDYTEDTFLARWIEGKLTSKELEEFKKMDAYKDFEKINTVSQQLKVTGLTSEQAILKVKNKITSSPKVKKHKIRSLYYAIAASVALIFGLFSYVNSYKTVKTLYGKNEIINLPDNSQVQLNADSEIKYKRFFWNENREIELKGEAFFKVTKGGDFKVVSKSGVVSVLGTSFNIIDRNSNYELNCYSGKVQFQKTGKSEKYSLEKGDQLVIKKEVISSRKNTKKHPNWLNGITIFKDEPIQHVLEAIERQFNIRFINNNNTNVSRLFTGSFTYSSLENALKTTLTPMGIEYIISENKNEVVLK